MNFTMFMLGLLSGILAPVFANEIIEYQKIRNIKALIQTELINFKEPFAATRMVIKQHLKVINKDFFEWTKITDCFKRESLIKLRNEILNEGIESEALLQETNRLTIGKGNALGLKNHTIVCLEPAFKYADYFDQKLIKNLLDLKREFSYLNDEIDSYKNHFMSTFTQPDQSLILRHNMNFNVIQIDAILKTIVEKIQEIILVSLKNPYQNWIFNRWESMKTRKNFN